MKKILFVIPLMYSVLCFSQETVRDSLLEQAKIKSSEESSSKFSVPEVPALNFISADPSNISRPSNVKSIAFGLVNGIDENGLVEQGLATEIRVGEYLPIRINTTEYSNSFLKYMAYNTQLSLGTIATSGDSSNTDLGWGIRITVFDNADPMKDKEYVKSLENLLLSRAPDSPGLTDFSETDFENLEEEIEKFEKDNWNASWLTLAYAGGTRLQGSNITNRNIIGHQVWVSGGVPIKNWGQLSFLGMWSTEYNENVDDNFEELELGVKFLIGKSSFNFFSEFSYSPLLNADEFEMDLDVDASETLTWLAGVEFKVADGVWAIAGIGEESDKLVGDNSLQLTSGLRFGISDKSRIEIK